MFEYSLSELSAQMSALPSAVPTPLRLWLYWLGLVCVLGPLVFLRHREARVVTGLQLGNVVFGTLLGMMVGLVRLVGLSHVIFWTPMAIYMFRRLKRIPPRTPFGLWARVFAVTVTISLVFDYIDVVRYVLGDRALLV